MKSSFLPKYQQKFFQIFVLVGRIFLVGILGEMMTSKIHSEFKWPLECRWNEPKSILLCVLYAYMGCSTNFSANFCPVSRSKVERLLWIFWICHLGFDCIYSLISVCLLDPSLLSNLLWSSWPLSYWTGWFVKGCWQENH